MSLNILPKNPKLLDLDNFIADFNPNRLSVMVVRALPSFKRQSCQRRSWGRHSANQTIYFFMRFLKTLKKLWLKEQCEESVKLKVLPKKWSSFWLVGLGPVHFSWNKNESKTKTCLEFIHDFINHVNYYSYWMSTIDFECG